MSSKPRNNGFPWINPVGGLGDALMLSGVLKQVVDREPEGRYNLVTRTTYLSFLEGHPALAYIGHPPADAAIIGTNYWSHPEYEQGTLRPYQILAQTFGLPLPVEEKLYLPGDLPDDRLLYDLIPWGDKNVLIAPTSASPRKEMDFSLWHRLVDFLLPAGVFVAQVGRFKEQQVRNAYSLRGLTTPRQLIALLKRFDVVITVDNFVMHAAHLAGTAAVALWGPTRHQTYGYPEQTHLQAPRTCGPEEPCIGPRTAHLYITPCALGPDQCLNKIGPKVIAAAVLDLLGGMVSRTNKKVVDLTAKRQRGKR